MANADSTAPCAASTLSPSIPVRPTIVRGQLCFAVADVAFTSFRLAACAWSAADAHRLDIAEPPLRRCEDCRLDLSWDVLRALGTCSRWGKAREGVESPCPAFVAKDGAK